MSAIVHIWCAEPFVPLLFMCGQAKDGAPPRIARWEARRGSLWKLNVQLHILKGSALGPLWPPASPLTASLFSPPAAALLSWNADSARAHFDATAAAVECSHEWRGRIWGLEVFLPSEVGKARQKLSPDVSAKMWLERLAGSRRELCTSSLVAGVKDVAIKPTEHSFCQLRIRERCSWNRWFFNCAGEAASL